MCELGRLLSSEDNIQSSGTRVEDACEPSCGCQKIEPGSFAKRTACNFPSCNISPNPTLFFFLRQDLSSNPEHTVSARLTDHWSPGICLSTTTRAIPTFLVGCWDSKFESRCLHSKCVTDWTTSLASFYQWERWLCPFQFIECYTFSNCPPKTHMLNLWLLV